MIGNEIIKYVRKATSLGIEIDNHLRWETQVKKVTKSFSAQVGQLRRMSHLPIKVKEEIYFKTIISTVTYGIIVWGTCSPSLMNDIERIHARAAKIIHRLPKHISDEDALEAAKWDKIEYISIKERFYLRCTKYSTINAQKYSDPILPRSINVIKNRNALRSFDVQKKQDEHQ